MISAFEVPVFTYSAERNKFLKQIQGFNSTGIPQLFDDPTVKASLFKNRYVTKNEQIRVPSEKVVNVNHSFYASPFTLRIIEKSEILGIILSCI